MDYTRWMLVGLALACIRHPPAEDPTPTVPGGVVSDLGRNLDHPEALERYRACLFLAELPAVDEVADHLQRYADNGPDPTDRACALYGLASRARLGPGRIEAFVEAFPGDPEGFKALARLHNDAGLVLGVSSPLERQMIRAAEDNDAALRKLVQLVPHTEASETLETGLGELYGRDPARAALIEEIAAARGVDLELVKAVAGAN